MTDSLQLHLSDSLLIFCALRPNLPYARALIPKARLLTRKTEIQLAHKYSLATLLLKLNSGLLIYIHVCILLHLILLLKPKCILRLCLYWCSYWCSNWLLVLMPVLVLVLVLELVARTSARTDSRTDASTAAACLFHPCLNSCF